MSRPARVRDARSARHRGRNKFPYEIGELTLGSSAVDLRVMDSSHAGAIITAILQVREPLDQSFRNVIPADDPDDTAHVC